MNEIRFRSSEEATAAYMKRIMNFPYIWMRNDRCDTCKRWNRGVYALDTGEFKCVVCLGHDYYERLVGKPEEN